MKITIALSKIGLDVVSNGDVIATNKLVRYEDLWKEIEWKKDRISSQSGREDARCNEEQDGHDGAEHCDAFRVVKLALQIHKSNDSAHISK